MAIESWVDGILHDRVEMWPMETHVESRLQRLPGIKAVLFDIYGTLVISGSGDVGSADLGRRVRRSGQRNVHLDPRERRKGPSLHDDVGSFPHGVHPGHQRLLRQGDRCDQRAVQADPVRTAL